MNIGINDKLDAMISLTAKECGNDDVDMFNNLDTSKVLLDKFFYVKQKQIINKQKHVNTVRIVKKWFVRVAVLLMALMSLGFLTIMATPDLREALFDAVIEWYDNYISIRYEHIDDIYDKHVTNEITEFTCAESILEESNTSVIIEPPTKIEKVLKPTYVPDGLEEDTVVNNITMVIIDYYKGEELVFSYQQVLFLDNEKLFDNQCVLIRNTDINGNIANIIEYSNREGKAIIWTDGIYYYQIYFYNDYVNEAELMNIASSVQ